MNFGTHGRTCGHSCCLRLQDLHCGEIVALIGPNGAGKSTLLKTILGQQDYSGTISFSVPGQRNRKAKIGYVPQTPTFDPGDPISVADLFSCCMSKRPAFLGQSKKMRQTILECLSRVHGESLIDKRIGTLSGGELQRVLLALALEPIPNILILDEPLSGVDIAGAESVMNTIDELRQDYDLSVLMTTHDFSTITRYADQVYLMDKSILECGAAQDVLKSDAFKKIFYRGEG